MSHTADAAVRVEASTFEELLATASLAMFSLMFDLGAAPEPTIVRVVEAEGDTPEDLVVDLLSVLLSWGEIEHVAYARVKVERTPGGVTAVAGGIPADRLELIGAPVKAVTYHGLEVARRDGRWSATILFDV